MTMPPMPPTLPLFRRDPPAAATCRCTEGGGLVLVDEQGRCTICGLPYPDDEPVYADIL